MGSTGLQPVYKLRCSCNNPNWGKQGSNSLAARLCAKQPGWEGKGPQTDFQIDESKTYAEMWMGTYPDLPSYVATTGENLQDLIDSNHQELVGNPVTIKFQGPQLPFLPKVLSISKALPLQLHPNLEMAAKLHFDRPDAFTDPNHKPEIALALGEFEAFCGFKPLESIAELMKIEPLKQFLPPEADGRKLDNEHLRTLVRKMLEADEDTVRVVYKELVKISPSRYEGLADASHIPQLAPRLAEQYSNADNGILVALITMNYLVLQAGESIYIPADGIHAYLSGDIIECMARSNNVLNTGFCPRAERNNAELFTSCLTFTPHDKGSCMLKSGVFDRSKNGKTQVYAPPLSEFSMLQTKLDIGEKEVIGKISGPSILLATHGDGSMWANGNEYQLKEGDVYFVAKGVQLEFEAAKEGLLMHISFAE